MKNSKEEYYHPDDFVYTGAAPKVDKSKEEYFHPDDFRYVPKISK